MRFTYSFALKIGSNYTGWPQINQPFAVLASLAFSLVLIPVSSDVWH